MTRYFLGIDIGATKSHALIADERGHAVGFGQSGSGNHEDVGWDGLREALHTITDQALVSAGIERERLAGAGLGIAGYDWPGERELTRQAIASLGLSAPFEFVNDAVIALLAGATRGWGVAVVAGTSNNCRGRDQHGREGRVTGCGPAFGEFGGAGELVDKAIQAVSRAWARRGPATQLAEAFTQLAGAVDVEDLLEGLALGSYYISHAVAPAIFRVAAEGDEVAQSTIRWAGRELGSLAVGVIRQLGFESLDFEVVLAGSLYDGGPLLTDAMRAEIHAIAPGARLVRLKVPPVVGGVLLAMEQARIQTGPLRPVLARSASELLSRMEAR
jgi:N-acetylglucosamine kinase-like BadF-type ATPase